MWGSCKQYGRHRWQTRLFRPRAILGYIVPQLLAYAYVKNGTLCRSEDQSSCMTDSSLENEDLTNARSSSGRRPVTESGQMWNSSLKPTREWAQGVLARTSLSRSIDTASLAHLGAKSFAAYKERKKQREGCDLHQP